MDGLGRCGHADTRRASSATTFGRWHSPTRSIVGTARAARALRALRATRGVVSGIAGRRAALSSSGAEGAARRRSTMARAAALVVAADGGPLARARAARIDTTPAATRHGSGRDRDHLRSSSVRAEDDGRRAAARTSRSRSCRSRMSGPRRASPWSGRWTKRTTRRPRVEARDDAFAAARLTAAAEARDGRRARAAAACALSAQPLHADRYVGDGLVLVGDACAPSLIRLRARGREPRSGTSPCSRRRTRRPRIGGARAPWKSVLAAGRAPSAWRRALAHRADGPAQARAAAPTIPASASSQPLAASTPRSTLVAAARPCRRRARRTPRLQECDLLPRESSPARDDLDDPLVARTGRRALSRRHRAALDAPHRAAGARRVDFHGWDMPLAYAARAGGASTVPARARACSTSRT